MLRFLFPVFVLPLVLLTGCGGLSRMMEPASLPTHGASAGGYGAIPFGTPKEYAAQLLGTRGFWSYSTEDMRAMMVTYYDRFGYYPVQVRQHFDVKGKSTKAEVYVTDALQRGTDESSCQEFYDGLYSMLQDRYGTPDWEPRSDKRGAADHSTASYTFADTSNIQLEYEFNINAQGPNCKVWLNYVPSLGWEGA